MLNIKRILDDPEGAEAALRTRNAELSLAGVLEIDAERRSVAGRFSDLRHEQKETSAAFGRGGREMAPDARAAVHARLKELSTEVKALEARHKELDEALTSALLFIPNLPAPEVPLGSSEADNPVLRAWGEPRQADFELLEHDVLLERLGLVDWEAARRISGARFALYTGLGARLERALMTFMLDMHVERHGYTEVLPPFLVSRESMTGTGQLPKFEEDAFRTEPDDLFLIPTAEVPVTNLHREQILDGETLPRHYAAYSSCFRREAGSYGRDTKGLTRLHQFQKVELVHFVRPEDSAAAHETLTAHAEAVLQALGLPYRVIELCTGDLGFSAQRCYDLEVWLAGQGSWREISSCSNFGDYQARRAGIRYRPEPGAKPRFLHTLNGSGLAIGRALMALVEHYQRADGRVDVPEALRPYMRVDVL